jgi:hypothetical protein
MRRNPPRDKGKARSEIGREKGREGGKEGGREGGQRRVPASHRPSWEKAREDTATFIRSMVRRGRRSWASQRETRPSVLPMARRAWVGSRARARQVEVCASVWKTAS